MPTGRCPTARPSSASGNRYSTLPAAARSPRSSPDAYPRRGNARVALSVGAKKTFTPCGATRSEEHTSELQSRPHLVCRLLLEKKKRQGFLHRQAYHDPDKDNGRVVCPGSGIGTQLPPCKRGDQSR